MTQLVSIGKAVICLLLLSACIILTYRYLFIVAYDHYYLLEVKKRSIVRESLYLLLVYSSSAIAFCFMGGFTRHDVRTVDIVYYPLGFLGVILALTGNDVENLQNRYSYERSVALASYEIASQSCVDLRSQSSGDTGMRIAELCDAFDDLYIERGFRNAVIHGVEETAGWRIVDELWRISGSVSEEFWMNRRNDFRMAEIHYGELSDIAEVMSSVQQSEDGSSRLLYVAVWPLLLALAVALKIMKTVRELVPGQ